MQIQQILWSGLQNILNIDIEGENWCLFLVGIEYAGSSKDLSLFIDCDKQETEDLRKMLLR